MTALLRAAHPGPAFAVTALVALTGVVEHPDVPLRRLVRACLFLGLRRAHFTAVSLVVLWVLAAAVGAMPVPALALLTAGAIQGDVEKFRNMATAGIFPLFVGATLLLRLWLVRRSRVEP